jgi:hypothetical protein
MTFKSMIAALVLLVLNAGVQTLHAEDAPKKFVEDFYTWYVSIASHGHADAASDIAIKKKSALFSPELLKALKEDSQAAAKNPGEVVGLDSDPFLNSQEQINRVVIGNVKEKNGAFRVDVFDVLEGKTDKKPNVIAEVKQENGHWIFVNFWSPDGDNLLNDLRALSKERKKTAK